jgi:hypothetical protein
VQHESGIYIYPNPASAGTAELVLPEYEIDLDHFQTRISIQGITGEIIYSATYESDGYVTHYTIPLIGLSPGVYLVNVNRNNKTFLRRLIIR